MSISISNGDKPCIVTLTWVSAFRHSWAVERSRPRPARKPWLFRVVISIKDWLAHKHVVCNGLDEFDAWCERHHCGILKQEYGQAREERALRLRQIQAYKSARAKLPKGHS